MGCACARAPCRKCAMPRPGQITGVRCTPECESAKGYGHADHRSAGGIRPGTPVFTPLSLSTWNGVHTKTKSTSPAQTDALIGMGTL
jgi:hypothetical protein